jgi:hypothetical protein
MTTVNKVTVFVGATLKDSIDIVGTAFASAGVRARHTRRLEVDIFKDGDIGVERLAGRGSHTGQDGASSSRRNVIGDFESLDDSPKPSGGETDIFVLNLGDFEVGDTTLEGLDAGVGMGMELRKSEINHGGCALFIVR